MLVNVMNVVVNVGLQYCFDLLKYINIVKVYELLYFVKVEGLQYEMEEWFMFVYFIEGKYVGWIDDLVELVVEVGLDVDCVCVVFESEQYLLVVWQDQVQVCVYGIQGVLFFVVDGQYGISGVQFLVVFENVFCDLWVKWNELVEFVEV